MILQSFLLQLKLREFQVNIFACELVIDTGKSFILLLHIILLCFVQINTYKPVVISFMWSPQPTVSLGKMKLSKIALCTAFWCGSWDTFAEFSHSFKKLIQLSNKDHMLPTGFFLQFTNQLDLEFLIRFQLRIYKKIDSFPNTNNLISLTAVMLSTLAQVLLQLQKC